MLSVRGVREEMGRENLREGEKGGEGRGVKVDVYLYCWRWVKCQMADMYIMGYE